MYIKPGNILLSFSCRVPLAIKTYILHCDALCRVTVTFCTSHRCQNNSHGEWMTGYPSPHAPFGDDCVRLQVPAFASACVSDAAPGGGDWSAVGGANETGLRACRRASVHDEASRSTRTHVHTFFHDKHTAVIDFRAQTVRKYRPVQGPIVAFLWACLCRRWSRRRLVPPVIFVTIQNRFPS